MLCRCRKCSEQIKGTLSSVYFHLEVKHHLYVDTIHDAEQYMCFPWSADAITNDILIPENIKELVRRLQYRKFFGGDYTCPCCHKKVSGGFEFLLHGKPRYLVCNDCVHLEIGVMVGDIVEVEDICNGITMSIRIQQKAVRIRKGILIATPNSPFGKGLIGKKIADTVEFETPRRKLRLHITSIY